MDRIYLLSLRIINGLLFIIVIFTFLSIFDYNSILLTEDGETAIWAFIMAIKNLLSYFIYIVLYIVGFGVSYIFSLGETVTQQGIDSFFKSLFGSWFTFSTPTGSAPGMNTIFIEIYEELEIFLTDAYLISFQVFFILAIVYALRAVYKSNPKYNLRSIGSIIVMIVLPLMIFGFRDMLDLFGVVVPYLENLPNPVNNSLTELPLDNFFLFFGSTIASLAIWSYIYLEIAFQINYTDLVTKPAVERSDRLEAQLTILRRESVKVIANVDKIKEEAKKRKQELELKKESVGKFFSKTGSTGFSYVKEMIEKKKLESEEKKLITAASKTRRLGRFIDRLFKEDPEAEDTLTAKSAAPRATNLATSTIVNFSIRLIILIIVSFIIIHPSWFLGTVIQLPPAIIDSAAMYSPESIIVLLLPIMLTFPVVAQAISYIKHRNLIIRLKQEGQIKQILTSVGDYVKVEEEEIKDEKKEEKKEEPTLSSEPAPEST